MAFLKSYRSHPSKVDSDTAASARYDVVEPSRMMTSRPIVCIDRTAAASSLPPARSIRYDQGVRYDNITHYDPITHYVPAEYGSHGRYARYVRFDHSDKPARKEHSAQPELRNKRSFFSHHFKTSSPTETARAPRDKYVPARPLPVAPLPLVALPVNPLPVTHLPVTVLGPKIVSRTKFAHPQQPLRFDSHYDRINSLCKEIAGMLKVDPAEILSSPALSTPAPQLGVQTQHKRFMDDILPLNIKVKRAPSLPLVRSLTGPSKSLPLAPINLNARRSIGKLRPRLGEPDK